MAKVRQRTWKSPGQRTKRKAWGFVTVGEDGKQIRVFRSDWSKEDAEKALAARTLEIEQPKPKTVGITFVEAVERYLAAKARKRSLAEDKRQLEQLQAVFGKDTMLADITASRISEYKSTRLVAVRKIGEGATAVERKLTAAAVNRPLALLRHMLRLAHEEWEVLDTVPRIRLEKEPQGRLRWLTEDEISRLLNACGQSRNKKLRDAVVIALNTGLRLGELLGLVWARVDLSRGVIQLEVTKSGRRREIPLNDDSYRALVSLGPKDSGRVFQTRYIKSAYNNAVKVARLHDVNFHTLRHTFASWAVMRGVALKELQELLGHASLTMTMRYAHLAPEHLRTAVSRLEGLTNKATQKITQEITQEATRLVATSQKSLK